MGFRRRYKRNFKNSNRRRKSNFRRFAKKIAKAVNYTAEKKVGTGTIAPVEVQEGTGAYFLNLASLVSGAQKNNRIGNRIKVRYIKLRLAFNNNGVSDSIVRVSIVRGRTAALTTGSTPPAWNSMWDIERFEVILDKTMALGNLNTNGMNWKFFNRSVKIFRELLFDDATTTLPTVNPIYLYVTSNDGLTPSPTVQGAYNITFSDL